MALIRIITILVLALAACSGPDAVLPPNSTLDPAVPEPSATVEELAEPEASPTPESTREPEPTTRPSATSMRTATVAPIEPELSPTVTEAEPSPTSTATSTATETPDPEEEETAAAAVIDEFLIGIEHLVEGREGLYQIVVIGPDGEPQYRLNDDVQVQAASLYKLLIMVEVFQQIEDGRLALDQPVRLESGFFVEAGFDDPFDDSYIGSEVPVEDLVRPMVMFSSNVAAYALLNLVGNANINATVAGLGLTQTEIRWMPAHRTGGAEPAKSVARYAQVPPETPNPEDAFNVTSAADMALLFRLMIEGNVVSPEASEAMLELLKGQVVKNRLPALLPPGAAVAHKTGNIDNVVHDVGVIFTPAGPAVVVVLTADAIEWEAIEFMQELALLVYEHGSG